MADERRTDSVQGHGETAGNGSEAAERGYKLTRRDFVKGVGTGVAAAAFLGGLPTIHIPRARAQATSAPVMIGVLEDYSGDLALYGIQKRHAAELAIKEINEGYTLKGGPSGSGGLGAWGSIAGRPPQMRAQGGDLQFVDQGGAPEKNQ